MAEQSPAALEGNPIASTGQDERTSTSDDSGETEDGNTVDVTPFLKGIETAIGNLVATENEDERQGQKEREIRDLDAQEGMVAWAKGMFWVTVATVFLTFAALVAIVVTLRHTKRAADSAEDMVEEAKKTTKAAFDAADVTREMGEVQTRAYLSVTNGSLHYLAGFNPLVKIEIQNTGQSPAYEVKAIFRASSTTHSICPSNGVHTDNIREFQLAGMLAAGSAGEFSFGIPFDAIFDTLGKGTPNKLVMMVEVVLEYQSVFDRNRGSVDRETTFRLLHIDSLTNPPRPTPNGVSRIYPMQISTTRMPDWIDGYHPESKNYD